MSRLLACISVSLFAAQMAGAAAATPEPPTISPPRPDRFCSLEERARTIAVFEAYVAAWRQTLSQARRAGADTSRAAANLVRFESELGIVRAAPAYRCTVHLVTR